MWLSGKAFALYYMNMGSIPDIYVSMCTSKKKYPKVRKSIQLMATHCEHKYYMSSEHYWGRAIKASNQC